MGTKKLLQGVGYNSGGRHKVSVKRVITPEYSAWYNMIYRCYNETMHEKLPQYAGCEVHKDWHDFQNFADWYESQDFSGLGYHLDKDLLVANNKVYSADTCCLIPRDLNILISYRPRERNGRLLGVSWHNIKKAWRSQISINGKVQILGDFDNQIDAHTEFLKAKKIYIRREAIKWKERIDNKAFLSLIEKSESY